MLQGVRPPPPASAATGDPNDVPRRRGPTWAGHNGKSLRGQQGYGARKPRRAATAERVFRGCPDSADGGLTEYEFHRSSVAKPRELGGGVGNIRSEIVVRREMRELIEVKQSIPTDQQSIHVQQLAALMSYFEEFEPHPVHGGSVHSRKQIDRMLRRQGWERLAAQLQEKHGSSPAQFLSAEAIQDSLQANRDARLHMEETLGALRLTGRLWPGGELGAPHGAGVAPEVPDINPRVDKGMVRPGNGFAITESATKHLKGELAAKVEGTITPAQAAMTARVAEALSEMKRSCASTSDHPCLSPVALAQIVKDLQLAKRPRNTGLTDCCWGQTFRTAGRAAFVNRSSRAQYPARGCAAGRRWGRARRSQSARV